MLSYVQVAAIARDMRAGMHPVTILRRHRISVRDLQVVLLAEARCLRSVKPGKGGYREWAPVFRSLRHFT